MSLDLFGRAAELAALETFLGRGSDGGGPAALVLEGEAGIGKSSLLFAGAELARERGFTLIGARPAEREFGLSHSALGDLFERDLDQVLPALPEPQRRALAVALLIESPHDAPPEPRAVAVAVRFALRRLAADGPLVVSIDDLQWLDAGSLDALAFALRRLDGADVRLLLATRESAGPLEAALDPDRLARVEVQPLSVANVRALVTVRLGRAFPRPVVVRLHEVSRGNPFLAIELARALAADATFDPGAPLAISEATHAVVESRIAPLPEQTRAALLVVAALGAPPVSLAHDGGADLEALAPAVDADVIAVADDQLRFTHPLIASHVYATATPANRRAVHQRLADLVDDPVAKARHLQHAVEGPDEAVAARLDEAAGIARRRGSPALAASLSESAANSTSVAGARHARLLAASQDHLAAGSTGRARTLALDVLDQSEDPGIRAQALSMLGELEQRFGSLRSSTRYRRAALELVPDNPVAQLILHQRLAISTRFTEGMGEAEAHSHAAVELAERIGNDALRACALATLAVARFNRDEPDGVETAERALMLARTAGDAGSARFAAVQLGHCLCFSGELDAARTVLEEARRSFELEDEQNERYVAWYLALVEQRAGRSRVASDHASRCRDISVLYGDVEDHPSPLLPAAFVAAFSGDDTTARVLAERALEHVDEREELSSLGRWHTALLAVLDHWSGDGDGAMGRFVAVERSRRAAGFGYSTCFWLADHVETLADLGRVTEAQRMVESWEQAATRTNDRWALAEIARSRGVIAAARSESGDAIRLLDDAVTRHEAVGDPFGRARALLALGIAHRHARRKRLARETITAAADAFDRIGNRAWARRARGEVDRIGGRTSADGLTPAETRVAELVAAGSTNREVAARLFLSERTVENHLSHVYAKVGVRSRTQLARRWLEN